MNQKEQEEKIQKSSIEFQARLEKIVRHKGTENAEFDCELCGANTKLIAFTTFMYPDLSVKALCNPCGKKEYVRLDYSNKN